MTIGRLKMIEEIVGKLYIWAHRLIRSLALLLNFLRIKIV